MECQLTQPQLSVINIHGGVFMLGHSRMVSMPQIDDCLARNWIVVVPNHRLCPQVNILEGPITDCRDLLAWIYDGHLDAFLAGDSAQHVHGRQFQVDMDRVMAFGTSSGGTLALSLVGAYIPAPNAPPPRISELEINFNPTSRAMMSPVRWPPS